MKQSNVILFPITRKIPKIEQKGKLISAENYVQSFAEVIFMLVVLCNWCKIPVIQNNTIRLLT